MAPAEAGTVSGVEGSEVTLSFQACYAVLNSPVDSFQWLFSKMNMTANDSSLEILDDSNAKYNFSSDMLSLTVSDISTTDAGYYTLTINTSMTVFQATIHLVVKGKC